MLQPVARSDDDYTTFAETDILRILNAFAVDVMTIPSAEDLFWYVAQNVVGRLNFIDCVIYQANDEQTELTQVAALGEKNPYGRSILNPLKIPFGEGITGRVAIERQAIVVDDLKQDDSYIPDTQLARSEICVPMIFRNRIVGVIDSEHPDANAFGEAELEVLTTVAAMTSARLELLAEADRSNQRYRDLMRSHEQLTEETSNRKALEVKLFEARKLEAIGRLTGGFAHDFNNLLTVISGNLELLQAEDVSDLGKASIEDACAAATRGATLIQNMLAFSQKSRLRPKLIDLNDVVRSTSALGRQTITDGFDVRLDLDPNACIVSADQNTTENALLNLILNARDAMPNGGTLTICTQNLNLSWTDVDALGADINPGRYVRLTVHDTGSGISEYHRQQVFDPFFTTKETGQGTGLGLSMILGFMGQSGGTVTVDSEIGQGSKFNLFFPAHKNSSATPLTAVEKGLHDPPTVLKTRLD